MKKFLTVLCVVFMMGALILSPVSNALAASSAAAKGTIGLSISTLNNPFFVTLSDGAKAKAKEMKVTLKVVDAGDDSAKQVSDIEDLVSSGVKVLIVNPVDSDAVASAVQDAIDAGVNVIAVDRIVNGVKVDCSIASDNVAGAQMAGEYLLKLLGNNPKIAELEGIPGASATVDRGNGFHKAVDGKAKVVASQTANFNRAEGLDVTENILQANPDVQGIFAHNDEMALGALEAIKSTGKNIVIVGFDATDDALSAVKKGEMAATVAQQPEQMGAIAVENAVKLMQGKEVPANVPVKVKLVTKAN